MQDSIEAEIFDGLMQNTGIGNEFELTSFIGNASAIGDDHFFN